MCCKCSLSTSHDPKKKNIRSVISGGAEDEQQQTNLSTNDVAAEYAAAESYHPTWYDRSHGWVGTTYSEAIDFCSSQQVVVAMALHDHPCHQHYVPTRGILSQDLTFPWVDIVGHRQ